MIFRVTDASNSAALSARIATARSRASVAQERIASGKRINRPSDDPSGAGTVARLRTLQDSVDGYRRTAGAAHDQLLNTDSALDTYQKMLDRAQDLLSRGASDATPPEARNAIATEIDSLRARITSLANTQDSDGYIFGGTQQSVRPVDPATGTFSAVPTSPRLMQLEHNAAPIAVGVTAQTIFTNASGTVLDTLANASAALRDTTSAPATRHAVVINAINQLGDFSEAARAAQTQVGVNLSVVNAASDRHDQDYLAIEETIQRTQSADLAQSAIELTDAQQALEATLRAGAPNSHRSLIDFLG